MKAVVLGLVVVAGCGRVAFDPLTGDARDDDAGPSDGRPLDAPPNAITVTFGERANADFSGVTTDTYISAETGETGLNYGASDDLRSESDVSERILLRFDLTAIPTTATVFDVALGVEVIEANAAADWQLRPVLEAWTEGTMDGTAGPANFGVRTTVLPWSTLGAGPPGSAGDVFATIQPSALGPLVATLPRAQIQDWVAAPETNFGMIFFNTNDGTARMASREATPDVSRPLLTVTYVP